MGVSELILYRENLAYDLDDSLGKMADLGTIMAPSDAHPQGISRPIVFMEFEWVVWNLLAVLCSGHQSFLAVLIGRLHLVQCKQTG